MAAAEAEAFHTACADEFHLLEDEDEDEDDEEEDEEDYEYDDGLDEGVVVDDDAGGGGGGGGGDDDDDDDDDDDGLYAAIVAAARLQSYPQATYVPSQGPRLSLDWKFRFQTAAAEKKAEGERRLDQGEEGWLLV